LILNMNVNINLINTKMDKAMDMNVDVGMQMNMTVGASLGRELLPPLGGKQTVDPLDQ
jgi:hypothetical protein